MLNKIKKTEEQKEETRYQELHDLFEFHRELLYKDMLKSNGVARRMGKTKYGSAEYRLLQFNYKVVYGQYSNHVESFIQFLDENEEELIEHEFTAIEQQKWKNMVLDARSTMGVLINSFEN
ncbi:MAG TPA: hypothetical protein VJH37_03720 [Candidatus Nanoarchaeia archaeon]|nr:hypothetical protein [Candidatus Nanoarchaeia archaeon]